MSTADGKQLATSRARQFSRSLAGAIEAMAGEAASGEISEANRAAMDESAAPLILRCSFGISDARLTIVAAQEAWSAVSQAALTGAGLEDSDDTLRKQTWQEVLQQAASALLADRAGDSAATVSLEEAASIPQAVGEVFAVILTLGGKNLPRFVIGLPTELAQALAAGPSEPDSPALESSHSVPPTLDRLLDVELPLSISFGRTHLPVQEILKLATGSIIELNCPANDYVEIIVNNCMIARGEVVVIEGNYGVRIREIISRNERIALQNTKGQNQSIPVRLSA